MLGTTRILDLTWFLGGPYAGQLLAQLGAEVIKVESLEGDPARSAPPYQFDGDSAFFLSSNRGKIGVSLDLKHSDGREAFYDLVRHSDAVVYGYAPDVPKRLGIDFDSLARINPKIVVAELIGLHDQGEYVRAPAFDGIVQALGGVMSMTGAEGGAPARVGYQIGDMGAGLFLALAVTSGLVRAAREGKGTCVQVSMLDCQLSLLTWQAQNYLVADVIPKPLGARNAVLVPSDAYRCADGRYVVISPTTEHFWKTLCDVLGIPEIASHPDFADKSMRLKHVTRLTQILGEAFSKRTADEWAEALFEARVPAAKVLDVAEAVTQPIARMRKMVEEVEKPQTGNKVRMLGNPFKYPESAPLAYPPMLGEATRQILRDVCGYSDDRIDALAASKAIHTGAA